MRKNKKNKGNKKKPAKKIRKNKITPKDWYLYILRCADDTFYTGITIDLNARLETHNSGKGARYTKARGPCELVYFEQCATERYQAMIRERAVKGLTRARKKALVADFPTKRIKKMIAVAG